MSEPATIAWREVDAARGGLLQDARRQLHHAAQFATAMGISYLEPKADDSHTNLEWIVELEALASNVVLGKQPVRLAVQPHPLSLIVLENDTPTATLLLNGRTIAGILRWINTQLTAYGIDASRYTLKRHYVIPPHRVAEGVAFDATHVGDFEQLASWFSNAASLLNAIAADTPGASVVRCWPHHFDIATLITVAPNRTVGVGLEPGDVYYDEPYFYVNTSPQPAVKTERPALDGGGAWHTQEWIGAVLPASRLGNSGQRQQCEAFLDSAISACTALARNA